VKKLFMLRAYLMCLLCWPFLAVAQNSNCFSIESILVDACGSPEGPNEMVRFRVGVNSLNVSALQVTWPNNSYLGICQNTTTASHVAYMNSTVLSCGFFLEPVSGVLPAGSNVLLITSVDFDPTAHDYAGLTDTIYVIFQCAGNTAGHFANWINPCDPLTGERTLTMSFGAGCINSVIYNRCSLTNQNGEIGGTTTERDGARVDFDTQGNSSYANDGCTIPYVPTTIQASANPLEVCAGAQVDVNAVVAGFNNGVVWTSQQGQFSQVNDNEATYSPSGNTGHYIYASTVNGCGDIILDSVWISIFESTPVEIQQSGSGCAAGEIQLTAIGEGEFSWNTGEITSIIFPDASGTYTVTMTDACGASSVSVEVEFGTLPVCGTVEQGPLAICPGGEVSITAFTDAGNGIWSTGATDLQIVANQEGYYVFTSSNGCGVCTDSILVLVADVQAEFIAIPTSGNAPLSVNVSNSSTGGNSYQWLLNGQVVSNQFEPELVIDLVGNYELTLVVSDANGCNSAKSVIITVFEDVLIDIPNVFTPNSDGVNDYFGITTNIALPARIQLLNRWGNMISEADLVTDDGGFTMLWDGKIDQKEAAPGVYFYKMKFDTPSNEIIEHSGFFTLIK
jgi:gliding motility-associated-like protein